MPYSLNDLLQVKKSQIKEAVRVFSKAFYEDPLAIWFFPDEEVRKEMLPHYFRFRINYGLLYGEVYTTSNNFEGLAIWLPSTVVLMTIWRNIRSGGISLYLKLGKEIIEKMSSVGNFTYKFHQKIINFPHWYLSPIGVDPIYQGKGFASKLMKSMLMRLDKDKIPCFLEAQTKKNVEIYQHYGFEVVGETTIPLANIPHWVMLRKPMKTAFN